MDYHLGAMQQPGSNWFKLRNTEATSNVLPDWHKP
jgi:hypothetical protein